MHSKEKSATACVHLVFGLWKMSYQNTAATLELCLSMSQFESKVKIMLLGSRIMKSYIYIIHRSWISGWSTGRLMSPSFSRQRFLSASLSAFRWLSRLLCCSRAFSLSSCLSVDSRFFLLLTLKSIIKYFVQHVLKGWFHGALIP